MPSNIFYDVVSIRPAIARGWIGRFTDDGYIGSAIPLQFLVRTAFSPIEKPEIEGLPSWSDSMYDISAKVSDKEISTYKNMSSDAQKALLRTVLTSRFNLQFHYVKRDEAVYALVPVKSGAKLLRAPPVSANDLVDDGIMDSAGSRVIKANSYNMSRLAQKLSRLHEAGGRKVIDCTGLVDNYKFTLIWSQDDEPTTGGETWDSGASIFSALRDQLGLELKSMRAPVDHLVIDHIEKPSAN